MGCRRRIELSRVSTRTTYNNDIQHNGRSLPIKRVTKVDTSIELLNGRQIGRLVAVLEGPC